MDAHVFVDCTADMIEIPTLKWLQAIGGLCFELDHETEMFLHRREVVVVV